MNDTLQLHHPAEWWIVHTPVGMQAVAYRPNTRAMAIGPFLTEQTARLKIDELLEDRRSARRLAAITGLCTLIVVTTTLLLVLP